MQTHLRSKYRMCFFAFWVILAFANTSLSSDKLDFLFGINADFRYRTELDARDFSEDQRTGVESLLRFRLGAWLEHKNIYTLFQLQYPKCLGWNSSLVDPDTVLHIHQAYLLIQDIGYEGLSIQLGRMELLFGDERLIGASCWDNIGRVYDGIKLNLSQDVFTYDLFGTIQEARFRPDDTTKTRDDYFGGIWVRHNYTNLNAYVLHNIESAQKNQIGDYRTSLSRQTLGIHYHRRYLSGWGAKMNLAYQMGIAKDVDAGTEQDISAMLIGSEISYEYGGKLKLAVGFDWTSGDDVSKEDKYGAFNNLYFNYHRYYGFMDYFKESREEGLRDVYIKMRGRLNPKVSVLMTLHHFTSDQEDLSEKDASKTKEIGNEINVESFFVMQNGIRINAGLGYFIPSEHWKGAKATNGFWAHLGLQMTFDAQLNRI